MRQKIQDLIKGKFEYDVPNLLLEEEELSFPVIEDEIYYGSFHIKSSDGRPVRGIVTCEHSRMNIPNPEFNAPQAEIRFEFSGTPTADEEKDDGIFVITSNVGEYIFPFEAQSTRHYLSTSIGKIKTINDFSNLCSLNWDEALGVFASPFFCNIFHEDAEYYNLLYNGLTERRRGSHEMEEFLIAVGKKQRVSFSVEDPVREYRLPDTGVRIRDSIKVAKSQWGYCDISVTCRDPFIELRKNHLQMYDFYGKHAELIFSINPAEMHLGRNLAKITLNSGFTKETVELTCIVGEPLKEHSADWKRRWYRAQLETGYLAYIMGEKPETEWILESIDIIDHALEDDSRNKWMNIFMAYIFYKAGDEDRMEGQLAQIPRNMRNARTPLAAMYQYITFLADDGDDRENVLERIREIQKKYRRHPILNWIILNLDDSYERNAQRKYEFIRQFMQNDCINPVFYYEAAKLLCEHPELLDIRENFDSRLIGWMSRKNLLSHELALRIQDMALGRQQFNRNYLHVLSKCYKKFGDESFIKAICVYLIHTNRYGETYFPWFRRGVEAHLKIAGLYEAYILSWSRSQGELPPEVVRYFSMNSTLPSRRKAMLFAYIVRNKNRLENDWGAYMGLVKDFAVSELSKGRMNDDLAIIYEEIRRILPSDEWDQVKNDCENCYKVYVGTTDFAAVRVLQNAPKTVNTRTPISGECAYIYLYSKPYVILYEGKDGRIYGAGKDCRVSKMLPGNRLKETGESRRNMIKAISGKQDSIDEAVRLEQMAGSIDEMSDLLMEVKAAGADVVKYAQQLMIRMLFTGHFGEHHQEIFSILRKNKDSEELLCAYASVLCHDMMIKDIPFNEEVYLFLWERLSRKKDDNPWYMAAYLRMYTENADHVYSEMAEDMLKEYIFVGKYFPFYEKLPAVIKRRYLLMGINVVSYIAEPGEVFYVNIQDGPRETLEEVLPGLYTYAFRLLPGEVFEYSVLDRDGRIHLRDEMEETTDNEDFADTRYGRLGELLENRLDDASRYSYAETGDLVNALFIPVKE